MTHGTRAPPHLRNAPLQPYALRHQAFVARHRHMRLCYLPVLALTILRTQGSKQEMRRVVGRAKCKFMSCRLLTPHATSDLKAKRRDIYRLSVNHLKSSWTWKFNLRAKRRVIYGPTVNYLKILWTQKLNLKAK